MPPKKQSSKSTLTSLQKAATDSRKRKPSASSSRSVKPKTKEDEIAPPPPPPPRTPIEALQRDLKRTPEETEEIWTDMSNWERSKYYKKVGQEMPVPGRRSTTLIDDDGTPLELPRRPASTLTTCSPCQYTSSPLIFYRNNSQLQFINDYRRAPWIPDHEATYIVMADEWSPEEKYFDMYAPIITYDLRDFYLANKRYFALQCNTNRGKREQNGNKLVCVDEGGQEVAFIVLHKLKNGDVKLQDEALFRKEQTYFNLRDASAETRCRHFLEQPMSSTADNGSLVFNPEFRDRLAQWARRYLATTLNVSLGDLESSVPAPEYTSTDTFIITLEDAMATKALEKSIKDYIREIASLAVFLCCSDIWRLAETFRGRLRASFYEPAKIPALTAKQKLPEIFSNPSVPDTADAALRTLSKDAYASFIMRQTNSLAVRLDYMAYNAIYPHDPIRVPDTPLYTHGRPPTVDLRPMSTLLQRRCPENQALTPIDFVLLDEGAPEPSCFPIQTILQRVQEGDLTSPVSGKPLPSEFVDELLSFNRSSVARSFLGDLSVSTNPDDDLTYDTLRAAEQYPAITDLLVKLADKEIEVLLDDAQPEETKCSLKASTNSAFRSIIRDRPQGLAALSEAVAEECNTEDGEEEDEPMNELVEEPMDVEPSGHCIITCEVCARDASSNPYRTIHDLDTPKLIQFCSIACFTKWEPE